MNAYITSARGEWSAEKSTLRYIRRLSFWDGFWALFLGAFLGQQFSLKFLYIIAAIFFLSYPAPWFLFIKKSRNRTRDGT